MQANPLRTNSAGFIFLQYLHNSMSLYFCSSLQQISVGCCMRIYSFLHFKRSHPDIMFVISTYWWWKILPQKPKKKNTKPKHHKDIHSSCFTEFLTSTFSEEVNKAFIFQIKLLQLYKNFSVANWEEITIIFHRRTVYKIIRTLVFSIQLTCCSWSSANAESKKYHKVLSTTTLLWGQGVAGKYLPPENSSSGTFILSKPRRYREKKDFYTQEISYTSVAYCSLASNPSWEPQ